jgi:hypothetical protein
MNDEQLLHAARYMQGITGARWIPQPPPPAEVDPETARFIALRAEQKKEAANARFAALRERTKGQPRRRKIKSRIDRVSSRPYRAPSEPRAARPGHKDSPAAPRTKKTGPDALATRLSGLTLDAIYTEAAIVLGTPEADLRAKYGHLNPGMQRMNLGNRMRAAGAHKVVSQCETPST